MTACSGQTYCTRPGPLARSTYPTSTGAVVTRPHTRQTAVSGGGGGARKLSIVTATTQRRNRSSSQRAQPQAAPGEEGT